MKKLLLATLLAFGASTASAQYMGTVPPNVDGKFYYSSDTDKFTVTNAWIGAAHESGFGARIGATNYRGFGTLTTGDLYLDSGTDGKYYPTKRTTNNDFAADSKFFQLTYVAIDENYNLHGAVGVRQTSFKTSTGKLIDEYNKSINDFTALFGTPTVINETLPLGSTDKNSPTIAGKSNHIVADIEVKLLMTDSLTFGLSAATDVVESANSIADDTRYVYTAFDVDLQLDDNLNLSSVVGNTKFSNDNNRPFLKTKVTWTFMPEYGLSVYLRTKNQSDSNAGSTLYFSPEKLEQQAIGLQVRKHYMGLVYTARAEYGNERATLTGGSITSNPLYTWVIGVQTNPGRKTGTTYGVSLTGSNSNGTKYGGEKYDWYGLNAWAKTPF